MKRLVTFYTHERDFYVLPTERSWMSLFLHLAGAVSPGEALDITRLRLSVVLRWLPLHRLPSHSRRSGAALATDLLLNTCRPPYKETPLTKKQS